MRHVYTIDSVIYIPSLGVTGPITQPVSLKQEEVLSIVRQGGIVYEHNPKNYLEKYPVTQSNYKQIHFITSRMDLLKKRRKTSSKIIPVTHEKEKVENEEKELKVDVETKNKKQDKKHNGKVSKPDNFDKN